MHENQGESLGVWKLCFIYWFVVKVLIIVESVICINTHKSGKAEVIEICLNCVIIRAAVLSDDDNFCSRPNSKFRESKRDKRYILLNECMVAR